MNQPNALEKEIINGAKNAHREYENMSGWWLIHGPEYFLTSFVSNWISKKGDFYVFPEASPKKIEAGWENTIQREPSEMEGKRFDIVVWNKSNYDLRAIIEIKQYENDGPLKPLRDDRDKLRTFLRKSDYSPTCYLLVYTIAKGDEDERVSILKERTKSWEEDLSCKLAHRYINTKGYEGYSWALALLRLP